MRKITNCVRGVLSALLSNIYLIDYDKIMIEKGKELGFIYKRYCDDILIICPTNISTQLKRFAIDLIKTDYKLIIQDKKAEIIDFLPNSKGVLRSFRRKKDKLHLPIIPTPSNENKLYKRLQYLGFEFDGQEIFIRSSSLSRYFRKMKARLDKTVKMAYSPSGKGSKIKKYQIYEKYSHLGKQNFLTYVKKAASKQYKNREGKINLGLDSLSIKKQLRNHMRILNKALEIKNIRRFRIKSSKKITINLKMA